MLYIGTDQNNRVVAWLEADENPDELLWVESPWETVPDDFDDYLYTDGELVYDPRDLPPAPYTTEQIFTALFEQLPEMMDALPDEVLEHMAPYMAPWETNKAYAVGDKVQYDDRPYRCLQAHTSIEQWNPKDAVSLWAKILTGGDTVPEWEQPDSTNPYMAGDHVMHNDVEWVSTVDNNVWEPGVYGWDQVA